MKLWVHRSFWFATILIGLVLTFQNCSSRTEGGVQPLPPENPLNTKLVQYQLIRPINYEVTNIRNNTIELVLMTEGPASFKIDIYDEEPRTLLQSGYLNANSSGEHRVSISLNSILRSWKGGWLRLEVSQNGETPISRIFGRGFLFFTAGQSNSANHQCQFCGGTPVVPSSDLVVFFDDQTQTPPSSPYPNPWPNISESVDDYSFRLDTVVAPLATGNLQNVWYDFGKKLVEEYSVPVAFIAVGVGGTYISEWDNDDFLFKRFQYLKYFKPTAILWHQGEWDAEINTSTLVYTEHLNSIIIKSRTLTGETTPWLVSIASSGCAAVEPGVTKVAQAQMQVINMNSSFEVYAGPNTNLLAHSCHFDTQSEFDQYVQSWFDAWENSGL